MNVAAPIPLDAGFYSIEAEQQLLGSLILSDRLTAIVMRFGGDALFYDPVHAELYRLIARKYNAGELVSPITLKAVLEGDDLLDGHGGIAYVVRLVGGSIFTDRKSVEGIAQLLGQYAQKRALNAAILKAQQELMRGEMPPDDIATRLEGALAAREMAVQTMRPTSMLAAVNEAISLANEAYRGETANLVRFGIPPLDRLIPGLYPGELTLLGGRPAMGKSAVALTMALNAARAGHGVAIASLEMTPAAMA
ncbi:hypothetical protein E4191_03680 [Paracoccus liaowanqingii]|uniref:DNA 5'-3' helicase n=1 Tax=Paracoccus liaowanqingii TaxID=2560053 RepID=A0A4P7HIJ6_9RHOB|nr:hypothetical protein E4191_03680 [Paracoccus liaowanqingii]